MCLMLYLATAKEIPLQQSPDMSVEEVGPSRAVVREWFTLPNVRYIGSHSGCSCGFPHIAAEEPIEYFEGIFQDDDDRRADLRSLALLFPLIQEHVLTSGEVQMYPVWDLEEHKPPKRTTEVSLASLQLQTFCFYERFLLRVTR